MPDQPAAKTVTAAEALQVLPAKPKAEPPAKPKTPSRVEVTYEGRNRVEHTLTGKVFEHGDCETMSGDEALDLQVRARGEEFTVRDVPAK